MINPLEMANIASAEEALWWFRGMREISFALLDPVMEPGGVKRILEAGCGTGHFAAVLQKRYGADVVAVDLETEAIRYCRSRQLRYSVQASVASLPFRDAAFDLVANMDVLPHFEPGQEQRPFSELARVLRPQGFLLVRVAALRIFRSRHSEFVWERQRFKRKRLEELARGCGLRIRRLTYANFLLTPVALLKFRVYEPLTRQPPSSGVHPMWPPLDRVLYLPLAMEKVWLSWGLSLPWGQSLFLLAQKTH